MARHVIRRRNAPGASTGLKSEAVWSEGRQSLIAELVGSDFSSIPNRVGSCVRNYRSSVQPAIVGI
jgi:hypothetical protein